MSSSSSSSLLSANERHAFDAFLSNVDDDVSLTAEWQLYSHLAPPHAEGSDALSKATKDLIALHPPPKFSTPRPIAPAPSLVPPVATRPPKLALALALAPPHPPTQPQKRPSPSEPGPSKRRRAASPSPPAPSRATLLSAQQKKANHIQSEQKRRANIRRGYEALCDTVPALREAIRAEEESSSGAGRKRRTRGDDGEKVDGRAGPRSESVVLQKTIEHITGLLDEKSALLARMAHAQAILGEGHPARYLHAQGQPLWERDWDGGKGIMMDVDGEQYSDEDE